MRRMLAKRRARDFPSAASCYSTHSAPLVDFHMVRGSSNVRRGSCEKAIIFSQPNVGPGLPPIQQLYAVALEPRVTYAGPWRGPGTFRPAQNGYP